MVLEENLMVKDLRAVITRKDKKAKEKEDQVNKSKTTSNNTGGVTCTELPSDAAREARGHWKHPLDFLFSCISVSVGLGSTYYSILFLANHNIHKSSSDHCFWASDPLIDRF